MNERTAARKIVASSHPTFRVIPVRAPSLMSTIFHEVSKISLSRARIMELWFLSPPGRGRANAKAMFMSFNHPGSEEQMAEGRLECMGAANRILS